ncbi:hypothetical protein [Streptomyces sclerotialus]
MPLHALKHSSAARGSTAPQYRVHHRETPPDNTASTDNTEH